MRNFATIYPKMIIKMKKRHLLLTLSLLLGLAVQAAPVSVEQARQKAARFLMERSNNRAIVEMQRVDVQAQAVDASQRAASTTARDMYYVFNADRTEGGYVVVSGDDRVPAILGYSETGTIDPANMPENMRAFLDQYARQIAYITDNNIQNRPYMAPQREVVAPKLTTTWDQGSPFNNKCPVDTRYNQRSATGCVATALAQVMNYHRYPAKTTQTIPAYSTWSLGIKVAAIEPTEIDWDNMRTNYRLYSTNAQKEAVATLMALCGAAVQMDYSATGSASTTSFIAPALRQYFGYTGACTAFRDDYTLEDWEEMVYNELTTNGPVYIDGQSAGGGHAFIVDGYDGNGYFHLNWGWSGVGNDYYLLTVLNPNGATGMGASSTEDGYSFNQDMLVGFNPNVTEPALQKSLTVGSIRVNGRTTLQRGSTGNFDVALKAMLYNMTSDNASFDYGLAFVDDNGQMTGQKLSGSRNISSYYGYEFSLTGSANLADGHYKAVAISKLSGQSEWQRCLGSLNYAIDVVVSGNTATLSAPSVNLTATEWKATGNTAPGKLVPLTITLTNSGTDFMRDVYLRIDNEVVAGRRLDIRAGETKDFEIDFGAEKEGTMFLQLCYDSENQRSYVTFASAALLVAKNGGGIVDGQKLLTFSTNVTGLSEGVMKANGELASTVTAKVRATNRGMAKYDDVFGMELLSVDAQGATTLLASKEQSVSLEVNDAADVTFSFENVPNQASYMLRPWYKDAKGNKTYDEENAISLAITDFKGIEHKLSIKITMNDLNTRVRPNKLTNANPHVAVQITNGGSYDYNDELLVRVCTIVDAKPVDIGKNVSEQLQLPVGEVAKREYDFTGLKNGEAYAFLVDYVTEGEMTYLQNYVAFIVDDPNADGIDEIVAMSGADKQVSVYDLNGRRVATVKAAQLKQTLRQLPKAIYVIEGTKMHN